MDLMFDVNSDACASAALVSLKSSQCATMPVASAYTPGRQQRRVLPHSLSNLSMTVLSRSRRRRRLDVGCVTHH